MVTIEVVSTLHQVAGNLSQLLSHFLLYSWYVALCHLPNILVVEPAIPNLAVVVVAPDRRLWHAYFQ